jgi:hypothetical protein
MTQGSPKTWALVDAAGITRYLHDPHGRDDAAVRRMCAVLEVVMLPAQDAVVCPTCACLMLPLPCHPPTREALADGEGWSGAAARPDPERGP